MEPPTKRLRMSPRNEPEMVDARLKAQPQGIALGSVVPAPTRTLDLRDFHRRRSWEERNIQPQRNAGIHLLPRVPDVTVTANIVNIAILDGSDQTSFTEIPAPTADLVIPISRVGTVTVPGITKGSEGPSKSTAPSGGSSSGSVPISSTSTNSTSINEKTVTVTSVSTLHVSVKNGTVTLTSASRLKTVVTAEGFTTTLDEGSNGYSGYRFGDVATSSLANLPSNAGSSAVETANSPSGSGPTNTPSTGGIVLTAQQQQVVGGVVGGVAGVALVLLGILYFLKWYRQRLKTQGRLPEQTARHRQLPSGDDHIYKPSPAMYQPSNTSLIPVATLKQSLQKLRPHSTYTLGSSTTDRSSVPATDSERSFQRVSGRKIPSVLLTGGNGYGDHVPMSEMAEGIILSRSHEVSQTNSVRETNNAQNPFTNSTVPNSTTGPTTPVRQSISPFVDPPSEGRNRTPLSMAGPSTSTRDFTASTASRSQLTIQTTGLSALNPNRSSDGNVLIRPSPARTPTTTSPTSSSLRLPLHTPPLMSGEIPEMPPLQPWRHTMGSRKYSDDTLNVPRSLGQRSMSRVSVRSTSSVGGKFREEI